MAIKNGDKIKVDYEGRFENGEVFDTSQHKDHAHPLEFTVGAKMVVPGFDKAVLGLEKDQEKEFTIEPEEGYGKLNPEMKKDVPREVLPKDKEPEVGAILLMGMPDGHQIPARIVGVKEKSVTIDLNHPLAGKKLIFKIKVVEIQPSK